MFTNAATRDWKGEEHRRWDLFLEQSVMCPGKMIGAFGGDCGSVLGLDPSGMPNGASGVSHEKGNKLA